MPATIPALWGCLHVAVLQSSDVIGYSEGVEQTMLIPDKVGYLLPSHAYSV
jgi:hypothetical protein